MKKIFDRIKNGNAAEIKEAKKELENCWCQKEKREELTEFFLEGVNNFDSIKNLKNREAFAQMLKYFVLIDRFSNLEAVTDFILKNIQHEKGGIRLAVIRAAENLAIDINYLPSNGRSKKFSGEEIEEIFRIYSRTIDTVRDLLSKYYDRKYDRYEYVNEIPSGIYKSLQMLYYTLAPSEKIKRIYREYRQKDYMEGFLKKYDFSDKDKWDLYYDAMELLRDEMTEPAKLLLSKALEIDKNFVAAHVGFVSAYDIEKNSREKDRHAELGYEKTLKKFCGWPEELCWGEVDNRQYFRALYYKAEKCHRSGDRKRAEELYRLLLKLNPNDNIGARYYISGLFAGLMPQDIDRFFDEGNRLRNWDKLEYLLYEQNEKHGFFEYPEEEW